MDSAESTKNTEKSTEKPIILVTQGSKKEPTKPNLAHLLIIRSGALGDVLMTTPLLRALRKGLPHTRITYLVGKWSASVLNNNPNIDEIMTFDEEMIFNKNYDEWLVSKRIPSIQTDTGGVSKRIPLLVSKRIPKKDRLKIRTKDINTVATEVTTGHDEINPILEMFQMKINPTINYGNKTQRQAVTDLLALMGFEKLTRTIDYVVSIRSEAFAPTITTPYQLKEKLAQLINYQQKQSSKSALIASI